MKAPKIAQRTPERLSACVHERTQRTPQRAYYARLAMSLSIVLIACRSGPSIRVERINAPPCISDKPPTENPRGVIATPDDKMGCAKKWFLCFDKDAGISTINYLAALKQYAETAYQRCGPQSKEEK